MNNFLPRAERRVRGAAQTESSAYIVIRSARDQSVTGHLVLEIKFKWCCDQQRSQICVFVDRLVMEVAARTTY